MSVTKANIITFVNEALREAYSGTDLDVAIQTCLNDLSKESLLTTTDDSQSLVSGDTTLDCPTGFREIVAITLTNASGNTNEPLEPLAGGHEEYRALVLSGTSRGTPEYYSEFDDKFWLWPIPGAAFSAKIEHFKSHPQDVDNIEFNDDFANVINFGTTYFKALIAAKMKYIDVWAPHYIFEKEAARLLIPQQPHIVRG